MLIFRAFVTAVLVAGISVGLLVLFIGMNSHGHSPELYRVVGEVFGAAVGVLFPVFALAFWSKKQRAQKRA